MIFPHNHKFGCADGHWSKSSNRTTANTSALSLLIYFGEGFVGWVGNFSVTSAPHSHTHVSGLVPRYSPIPKPFGCGCALEYLFLCTSEHFHFHCQGSLHHPHQLHPNTPSPQPTSAQVVSFSLPWHFQVCLRQDASDIECKIILIGPVHIAHQSINLDISVGLATPLPDLCCHWSLLRHCNHLQCFVIQDTLQISSFVLDIIKQYLYLHDELPPSYPHLQESFWSRNDIPMAKGHRYRPCIHHSRLFFFNSHDYIGQVIISEQLAPAHSWTRCLLELHVHHCLGEPHHLLFPRLRGFPLLIAMWRSQMVCLLWFRSSLSIFYNLITDGTFYLCRLFNLILCLWTESVFHIFCLQTADRKPALES